MKCSFCRKKDNEVHKLIVASDKVAICDVCVMDCLATLVYPDETIEIDLDEVEESDQDAQANSGC